MKDSSQEGWHLFSCSFLTMSQSLQYDVGESSRHCLGAATGRWLLEQSCGNLGFHFKGQLPVTLLNPFGGKSLSEEQISNTSVSSDLKMFLWSIVFYKAYRSTCKKVLFISTLTGKERTGLTGLSAPLPSYWAYSIIYVVSQVLLESCPFFQGRKSTPLLSTINGKRLKISVSYIH